MRSRNMNLAYIIVAHNNFELLKKNLRKLYRKEDIFFIHINSSVDNNEFNKLKKELSIFKNVIFMKRINVVWGKSQLLDISLTAINYLIENKFKFEYCFFLSGVDYLIKRKETLHEFLINNNSKEYIGIVEMNSSYENRYKYYHTNFIDKLKMLNNNRKLVVLEAKICQKLRLKPRYHIVEEIYKGSPWWCLTSDAINYIYRFVNANYEFRQFFKNVLMPEEMFYQTILMNSNKFKEKVTKSNLTYIDWNSNPAPKTLDLDDFDQIIESNKFFVRKLDEKVSYDLIKKIDEFYQEEI